MQGIMPPTLEAIIATSANFDDEVYKLLEQLIQKPTSTDPIDSDILEVAHAANVSEEDLRYFLSFLSFLFAQTSDTANEDLKSKLNEFLVENGGDTDVDRVTDKLLKLLAHRDVQLAADKRTRLADGFLPNLLGAASFVDLRHDFERDSDGVLTGNLGSHIPVIQLEIRTNSSIPSQKMIVLQLDEKSLEQMQNILKEIRMKLDILDIV